VDIAPITTGGSWYSLCDIVQRVIGRLAQQLAGDAHYEIDALCQAPEVAGGSILAGNSRRYGGNVSSRS
jgi:hypothetical protein